MYISIYTVHLFYKLFRQNSITTKKKIIIGQKSESKKERGIIPTFLKKEKKLLADNTSERTKTADIVPSVI